MIRILLTCLIVLPATVEASQAPVPAGSRQEQQGGPNIQERNPTAGPSVGSTDSVAPQIPLGNSPTPEQPNQATNEEEQLSSDWLTVASGFSNVVMAVFAVALFFVARGEWKLNRDTLHTTRTVERAYLGAVEIELNNLARVPKLAVRLLNSGRLPATLLRFSHTFVSGEPLPSTPEHPEWKAHGGVIAPGQHITVTVDFVKESALSEEELVALRENQFPLFVYGAFQYDDGFGETRTTGYGFEYDHTLLFDNWGKRLKSVPNADYNYMR